MKIHEIKYLREKEDNIEFKKAATQYSYNSSRKSVLGYVVALANEGGGKLILGVTEKNTKLRMTFLEVARGRMKRGIWNKKFIMIYTLELKLKFYMKKRIEF